MVSLNDVLLAMSNIPVDDPIAEIWGRGLQGGYEIIEYTGTLPITITADGNALLDYRIYGNTVQGGTPTPESPVVPSGCGELETTGVHAGQYKLPMLSNSAATNIYLGEAETTRRIKKLVLTGKENWSGTSKYRIGLYGQIGTIAPICTHYRGVTTASYGDLTDGRVTVNGAFGLTLAICDTVNQSSLTAWKSYLAAQYAAGTPVTVWYVLANEETGVVNEPLMKIGDYADTIDSTQVTVQIPTVAGTTTIDYDGAPKPSMYIKYRGR